MFRLREKQWGTRASPRYEKVVWEKGPVVTQWPIPILLVPSGPIRGRRVLVWLGVGVPLPPKPVVGERRGE